MLDGPLLPSIIRFAIPIALTNLIQLLFNAADLIVVAQFCGSVSVASVGATSSLTGLIVNLFMGLSDRQLDEEIMKIFIALFIRLFPQLLLAALC